MCYRFPTFGVCAVVIVFGECVIVFQSKTLRQESNVHPLHISYDRYKNHASHRDAAGANYTPRAEVHMISKELNVNINTKAVMKQKYKSA